MSKKQDEARRANAQRSTGPCTNEGKARSSMNALKTGIDAETNILPDENLADFQHVLTEWHGHYKPTCPASRLLVDRLAGVEWLFRRFLKIETTTLAQFLAQNPKSLNQEFPIAEAYSYRNQTLGRLQIKVNALDRNFHKDLDQLAFLQATQPQATQPQATQLPVEAAPQPEAQPEPAAPPVPATAELSTAQPTAPKMDNPASASFPENPTTAPEPTRKPPARSPGESDILSPTA